MEKLGEQLLNITLSSDDLQNAVKIFAGEFSQYALEQEDYKARWESLKEEAERLTVELQDANVANFNLQRQNQHTIMLLDEIIKERSHNRQELKSVQIELNALRNRPQLLEQKRSESLQIKSADTTKVFQSEWRTIPLPSGEAEVANHKSFKCLVATTTVTIPKTGPTTATAVIIENQAKPNEEDLALIEKRGNEPTLAKPTTIKTPKPVISTPTSSRAFQRVSSRCDNKRLVVFNSWVNQRPHNLSQQKTVIKPEDCLSCCNRIKFGNVALKCLECHGICHVDCKSRMPVPCVPTVAKISLNDPPGTLASHAPKMTPMIPGPIIHCVTEIERRGMSQMGIYRINGLIKDVDALLENLLRAKGRNQLSEVKVHVVAGALKLFLRKLKEPIITYELWENFTSISEMDNETDIQTEISSLILKLPQHHRDTLVYLIIHLQKVAEMPTCQMSVSSLAKIFGPTIVGYSHPELGMASALYELKKQHSTMEKLLRISNDFWHRFVVI